MKTLNLSVAALVLAGMLGCATSSPRGGGMSYDEGFNVVIPHSEIELQQGAVQTQNLTLLRGDNFKQNVKLAFKADKGISVDPSSLTIKASAQPEAQIRVGAAKDAALGEYRVTLTGTPDHGEQTHAEFRVKVVAP